MAFVGRKAGRAGVRITKGAQNEPRYFYGPRAGRSVHGGNVMAMAKMLNDAGCEPRLSETAGDPVRLARAGSQVVTRLVVIDLLAMRADDRVGRKLAMVLQRGHVRLCAAPAIEQG